jgi:hypothetical protein
MSFLLIFLISSIIFYWIKKPIYLNAIDPLQLLAIPEGLMIAVILSIPNISSADKYWMIAVVGAYGISWVIFVVFGKKFYFIGIKQAALHLKNMPYYHYQALYFIVLLSSLTLFVFGSTFGWTGDNRLLLTKLFRPLEGLWMIGFQVLLLAWLLRSKYKSLTEIYLMLFLIFLLVATIGKGFSLNILLPVSIFVWISNFRLTPLRFTLLSLFMIALFSIGLFSAHGVSPALIAKALWERIINDSDVYILGFSSGVLDSLEVSSFFSYVFGPLFKIIGLSWLVDTNIGAQIGSFHNGRLVATGPNAQLPYLFYIYFADDPISGMVSIILLLLFWFYIKFILITGWLSSVKRSQFVFLLFYALAFPQTVIKDPTYTSSFLIVTVFAISIFYFFRSFFSLLVAGNFAPKPNKTHHR